MSFYIRLRAPLCFFMLVLFTSLCPFSALGQSCHEVVAPLPGAFDVKWAGYDGKISVKYFEIDSYGEPVDRGVVRAFVDKNSIYVERYWVDGGEDSYGLPSGLRKGREGTTRASLRGKGLSRLIFVKLLEATGEREIVHAELAYTNLEIVKRTVRENLGLEKVEPIEDLSDVKKILEGRRDPTSPHFVAGFNEFEFYKRALANTPFLKVWHDYLGYTQFDKIELEWQNIHTLEKKTFSVHISLRKPK